MSIYYFGYPQMPSTKAIQIPSWNIADVSRYVLLVKTLRDTENMIDSML